MGYGLSRKGVGHLKLFDNDYVESSNLNRQFFFKKDIGKPKGERLAINLSKHSFCGTHFSGYGLSFQDAIAFDVEAVTGGIGIIGVDNGTTRIDASNIYRKLGIPTIFIAVDLLGQSGYVYVQESKPDAPCFGCKFPKTLNSNKVSCRTPAVIDILQVVSGFALYAIDSLLMDRKRNWNYREVSLAGFMDDVSLMIEKRDDCPLCGNLKHVK